MYTLVNPSLTVYKMSRVLRKPAFCICENKDADQLRGNHEADQRLCFRCTDSTIPLPPIYEISSFKPHCVVVQPGLCGTWSETPKTGFLTTRLIYFQFSYDYCGVMSNQPEFQKTSTSTVDLLKRVSFSKTWQHYAKSPVHYTVVLRL